MKALLSGTQAHLILLRLLVASLLALLTALSPAHATPEQPTITSQTLINVVQAADVFTHVTRVQNELELLRFTMGKPNNNQAKIEVSNVAPREVYYQALTLFRKANRLSFEQTRTILEEPLPPKNRILPGHVFEVVDTALKLIIGVKNHINITEKIREPQRDAKKQPTDVFKSIVQANRQLNILLDKSFAPKDVYQNISLAMGYTSRLLSLFPNVKRLPTPQPIQPGTTPGDVFKRLDHVYKLVRKVANLSGIATLEWDTTNIINAGTSVPSDVYDIASLVLSEIAFIHAQNDSLDPPYKVYDPGRKFPSHVLQRVGMLEDQLTLLLSEVKKNPKWLKQ